MLTPLENFSRQGSHSILTLPERGHMAGLSPAQCCQIVAHSVGFCCGITLAQETPPLVRLDGNAEGHLVACHHPMDPPPAEPAAHGALAQGSAENRPG